MKCNTRNVNQTQVKLANFYDQTIGNHFACVSTSFKLCEAHLFCYYINCKDMTCHKSKISFFEYVR